MSSVKASIDAGTLVSMLNFSKPILVISEGGTKYLYKPVSKPITFEGHVRCAGFIRKIQNGKLNPNGEYAELYIKKSGLELERISDL